MTQTKTGLKPLKKDNRDRSYPKTFGTTLPIALPDNYFLPSAILNQLDTDHCTSYSASAIKATEFGVDFDPEDYYVQEGIINGASTEGGYDLRVPMKTGVKYGAKPLTGGNPAQYENLGYYAIHGNDMFEAIRSAMYQERAKKRCALTGVMWYQDWTMQPTVQEGYKAELGLHALKVAGWKTINGVTYLIIQNSWGAYRGDGGYYYFPKSIVNREFTEGAFLWSDNPVDPLDVKTISAIQDFLNSLANFLKSWFNSLNKPVPTPEPTPIQPTPQPVPAPVLDIPTIIANVAKKNGVEPELCLAVASCEGGLKIHNARNQNKNPQGVLLSTDRGCFQWNNKVFPAITDAMADDPEKATQLFCDAVKQRKLHSYWYASQPCWKLKLSADLKKKYNII